MKYFCLSFDLEEFDVPKEIGLQINEEEMFSISFEGVKRIKRLVDKYNISSTFFVTTDFYKRYKGFVKELSRKHEIAFHGEHNKDYSKISSKDFLKSIREGKRLIEKGTGKKVSGFRAPRMMVPDYSLLKKVDIKYDASLHPTYIPMRYNHFFSSRKIFKKEGVVVVPTSVLPLLRAPFTWAWFRNFSLAYSKVCTSLCLSIDGYVNIYFHPWEFVELNAWKIPNIFVRNTGKAMSNKLDNYLNWLAHKDVSFLTLEKLVKRFS